MADYKIGDVYDLPDGTAVKYTKGGFVPHKDEPSEWSDLIGNIPASAAQAGEDILSTLNPMNWPEMASTLGKTAAGGLAKRTREMSEQLPESAGIKPYEKSEWEQYPEALGRYAKGRYGSPEAIKETLITDPAGAGLDLTGLLAGGGSMLAKSGGMAEKIGKAGMATDPINLMVGGAKTAAGKLIPRGVATDLYKRAAKFPGSIDVKDIGGQTKLAETALKHKIMPTEKGIIALEKYSSELGDKLNKLIDKATKSGKTIPKAQLYSRLKEARRSVGGLQIDAKKDLAQVNKVAKDMTELLDNMPGNTVTPAQMQKFKQSAQKKAKYSVIPGQKPETGTEQASKATARAAREGVESVVPEVADINKELSSLIKLNEPLRKAASRIERRDLIGLGAPAKIVTGAQVGDAPAAAIGGAAALLEANKAKIAIKLRELQDAGMMNMIDPKVRSTLIQQGLLQGGRAEDEAE